MKQAPQFWIIAGVNGAGKTTTVKDTLFGRLIGDITYLNPDEITADLVKSNPGVDLIEANLKAARKVEKVVESYLTEKNSIAVETVLSSSKYEPLVELARKNGFEVNMIYVGLEKVEQSVDRIAQRVKAGGHDVPFDKIQSRWAKSLDNLAKFLPKVDNAFVYSNTLPHKRILVAIKQNDKIHLLDREALPEVTKRLEVLIKEQGEKINNLKEETNPRENLQVIKRPKR